MNASRMTKVVAEGIALWAAVQDLPGNKVQGSPELGAWLEWADRYPILIDRVKKEQSNLFDRILQWK